MNSNRYPFYGLAILAVAGLALWAGLPPIYLIFLVLCPLMMFVMMRGMHGGHGSSDASTSGHRSDASTHPADLDGSHERIDRP